MGKGALDAMQVWLMELANEGRSPRTIAAYEKDVEQTMSSIAEARRIPVAQLSLAGVDRDSLVASIAEYRTRTDPRYRRHPDHSPRERSPATIGRRLAALRVFFGWCYETGRITADPAALMKAPPRAKRLPKSLDAGTARLAMEGSPGSRWPERDQLIVVLALTTGLRLEEMATLKMIDLHGSPTDAISVVGKGNKERNLPLPAVTREVLLRYLPTRAQRLSRLGLDARTLLISTRRRFAGHDKDGDPIHSVEATRAGVAYVVDRILRSVGARRRGGRVHVLRHTFATLGLRPDPRTGAAAFTVRQLQKALGHANLATIQVYTEVSDEELVRAAETHPLAR